MTDMPSSTPVAMRTGAFALMDCLGFKGKWRDAASMDSLVATFRKVAELRTAFGYPSDFVDCTVSILSDTVVISCLPKFDRPQSPETPPDILILIASTMCSQAMQLLGNGSHPIAVRGCVGHGRHVLSGGLLIGEVVDEVAEYHQLS